MGAYRVDISDLAKQDIRDTASYIKNQLKEPTIAESTVNAILDAISTLEDMPMRIPLVNDERLAKMHIRGLQNKNYTAFFRVDDALKVVDIIRVLYSRRDWQTLL